MLFHHLFFSESSRELYNDITIHGVGIVNQFGIFSKLCVSVFVFVSGYGLAVSTPIDVKLKDFYLHRFKKLYLNYWFIWIFFVPISVFLFGRSFTDAYGENAIIKSILDFFGILKMFNIDGYNPTWWFYNCIIVLYLFFPLLNKYLYRIPFFVVSISLSIGLFWFLPGINVIAGYLLAFVTGMLSIKIPQTWVSHTQCWLWIIAMGLLAAWRLTKACPQHIADSFLCLGLFLFLTRVSMRNMIGRVLEELGKHSMNMFLTHTFIYYFWFKEYIYISRNPLLIFLSLVVSSYWLSILIEWFKRRIGFYKIL